MVCSLFFCLILYYYLSSVFFTRRYYSIKYRFPIKSHASQKRAWTDSEELTQWRTRRSKKHEVSGGPGAAIESCYKTVYCETGVCVRAYYCLCLIGTWHWRASLAMLRVFFAIWLWVRCEEGRRKCIYTLSAGFNLPDWNGVNLGLHLMHNTKRAYMCKEKDVTKHNVSDVQPRLCFNLLVHLLLACVRTVTLTPRYFSCSSGIYSEYLRNIQYFSDRSRVRVWSWTRPRHTLTPT